MDGVVEKSINVNNILYKTTLNNKSIIFPILLLFIAFYLQDTVFTRYIADITKDIPNFVKDVDIQKMFMVILPFISAIAIFYVSNIISSKKISKIEVEAIHELTSEVIESVKTDKKKINVNTLMGQLKKISEVKNIYTIFTFHIIPTIVITASLMYNFFRADTRTGFYVGLIILILVLITIKLESDSMYYAYEAEKASNELYEDVNEIMVNMDSIVTSDTKTKELENIDVSKNKAYEMAYTNDIKNGNTTYGLQLISLVAIIGINYLSYKLYMKEDIGTTTLITIVLLTLLFMDYYNYCVIAIKEVQSNIGKLYDAHQYFSDFKILSAEPFDTKAELRIKKGDIKFENIKLKYDDKVIFDNLNLLIDGHSKVGIMGPIGSGKTTLLQMLAGITKYEGNIYIDGQNLKKCTYESIAQHVAYISQHPKLFNKSILYNISYGTNYNEAEVEKRLKEFGLMGFFNTFPQKLHTLVGKEGSDVSGGQRQFISFVRSLIQNKSIILLDEPSSSLDPKNKKILMDSIKNLKNKTIIITTHDNELKPIFDKVINNLSKSG